MNVGCIVEGDGEVDAAPVLLRRCAAELGKHVVVLPPQRVPRNRLLKPGELERAVELIARKVGEGGAILILLDADDDCPAALGPSLLGRARATRPDRAIEVVLAKREYEAWFLASARSLRGLRGLPDDLDPPPDAEAVRDAKGWLDARMKDGYRPTLDQPAFTAVFSMTDARVAPSFDKLRRAVDGLLLAGPAT